MLNDRILRFPEVEQATGRTRSSINSAIRTGHFPQPVKIGARAIGWRESVIAAWMDQIQRAADAKQKSA
jgi:prophage regulatory protein